MDLDFQDDFLEEETSEEDEDSEEPPTKLVTDHVIEGLELREKIISLIGDIFDDFNSNQVDIQNIYGKIEHILKNYLMKSEEYDKEFIMPSADELKGLNAEFLEGIRISYEYFHTWVFHGLIIFLTNPYVYSRLANKINSVLETFFSFVKNCRIQLPPSFMSNVGYIVKGEVDEFGIHFLELEGKKPQKFLIRRRKMSQSGLNAILKHFISIFNLEFTLGIENGKENIDTLVYIVRFGKKLRRLTLIHHYPLHFAMNKYPVETLQFFENVLLFFVQCATCDDEISDAEKIVLRSFLYRFSKLTFLPRQLSLKVISKVVKEMIELPEENSLSIDHPRLKDVKYTIVKLHSKLTAQTFQQTSHIFSPNFIPEELDSLKSTMIPPVFKNLVMSEVLVLTKKDFFKIPNEDHLKRAEVITFNLSAISKLFSSKDKNLSSAFFALCPQTELLKMVELFRNAIAFLKAGKEIIEELREKLTKELNYSSRTINVCMGPIEFFGACLSFLTTLRREAPLEFEVLVNPLVQFGNIFFTTESLKKDDFYIHFTQFFLSTAFFPWRTKVKFSTSLSSYFPSNAECIVYERFLHCDISRPTVLANHLKLFWPLRASISETSDLNLVLQVEMKTIRRETIPVILNFIQSGYGPIIVCEMENVVLYINRSIKICSQERKRFYSLCLAVTSLPCLYVDDNTRSCPRCDFFNHQMKVSTTQLLTLQSFITSLFKLTFSSIKAKRFILKPEGIYLFIEHLVSYAHHFGQVPLVYITFVFYIIRTTRCLEILSRSFEVLRDVLPKLIGNKENAKTKNLILNQSFKFLRDIQRKGNDNHLVFHLSRIFLLKGCEELEIRLIDVSLQAITSYTSFLFDGVVKNFITLLSRFYDRQPYELFNQHKEQFVKALLCISFQVFYSRENQTFKEGDFVKFMERLMPLGNFRRTNYFFLSFNSYLVVEMLKYFLLVPAHNGDNGEDGQMFVTFMLKGLELWGRNRFPDPLSSAFSQIIRMMVKIKLNKRASRVFALFLHSIGQQPFEVGCQDLISRLLLSLSIDSEKVLGIINFLLKRDENETHGVSEGSVKRKRKEKSLSTYPITYIGMNIACRLLVFEERLFSESDNFEEKKEILASLAVLIKILPSETISDNKVKLFSSLVSYGSLGPRFHFSILLVWRWFIIRLEKKAMESLVVQICSNLLSLRRNHKSEVDSLLSLIVLEMSEINLRPQLHFLENLSPNIDFPFVKEVKEAVNNLRKLNWIEFLKLLLSQCTKENSSNIRLSALKKIKQFLQEECENIQRLVVRDQKVQSIIHIMIRRLLELNECAENELRDLCAECLGLLGALDPFRFNVLNERRSESSNKIFSVESADFLTRLLNELARFIQKSEKRGDVERIGLVLQRLLRFLKPHGGEELVDSLKKTERDVLLSFQTSCYAKAPGPIVNSQEDPQSVVYLSSIGTSLQSWISAWQSKLTKVVKRGFAKDLFDTLEALPGNYETAMLLLPHLVMYSLVDATGGEVEEIFNEFSAVLAISSQKEKAENGTSETNPMFEQPLHVEERKDQTPGSSFKGQAMKIVFAIIDHLNSSLRLHKGPNSQQSTADTQTFTPDDVDMFASFLKKIPNQALASAAYECEAYARALMYFEQNLKELGHFSDEMTPFAIRLFLNLNDLDSVSGIIGRKGYTPPTHQSILINLANGEIEKTILKFDELMNEKTDSLVIHQGIVQLYCALGNTQMAQKCLKNVFASRRWPNELDAVEMEIAKRDGDYKRLEQLVSKGNELSTWSFTVSDTLLNLRSRNFELAKKGIVGARRKVMEDLAGSLFDYSSNTGGFEKIVRLHVLEELDEIRRLMGHMSNQTLSPCLKKYFLKKTMKNWEDRFHSMDHSLMIVQPILTTREVLLDILLDSLQTSCPEFKNSAMEYIKSVQEQSWFFQIKQHCRLGNVNRAERMMKMIQSKGCLAVNYFQEAKMFNRLGCKEKGREVLLSGFSAHFPQLAITTPFKPQNTINEWKSFWGRFLLLTASLSFDLKTTDKDLNGQMFTAAAELRPCEKSFYALAKFYEETAKSGRKQNNGSKEDLISEWADSTMILKTYAKVLRCGTDYVYESLPKILNIWFNFGAQESKINPLFKLDYIDFLKQMSEVISGLCKSLSPHILFTSFSLLLSRLVAKNVLIKKGVGEILEKVITAHPAQTLWLIMHDINSENPQRKKRMAQILNDICEGNNNQNFRHLVLLHKSLASEIEKLCLYSVPKKTSKLSLKDCAPKLGKLITQNQNIFLIPYQEFLNPNLSYAVAGQLSHSPFSNVVYINGIHGEAEVLCSLQKPVKIKFIGSNGKKYIVMCKQNDDLRRDLKMMEVIHVINWYLARERESRQRNLRIRTFAVIPINASCGMIEWVLNLQSIRSILTRYYKEANLGLDQKDISKRTLDPKKPLALRIENFRYLVSHHPPVFDKWFLNNFTDPSSWIEARNTYIRTTAVMSIVGYIMGLGDRHGENILINTLTGEIVHVDYNCIFNKGETLNVPEVVPFRLTHNIVAGMGPFGKDGIFRKACETVLKVVRSKESVFESVVATFKYDPLEEWRSGPSGSDSEVNPLAMETLERVTMRMRGSERMMKKVDLELAPEPLVDYLISEATSEEKLASMYFGWAPYM